ncbi:hypothetical protein WJX74_005858 [Apatococcus lobatus]|uniref:Small integral membrane protein 8 n=1 Tax=Apatococcus lobatus TaxID=904363 RepID=A0AAW1RBH3_9CHLO
MADRKPHVQSEPVTTQGGSGPFRALNFELYTKPVGKMKVLAYVGSAAAAGILGYMVIQKQEIQRSQKSA